MDALCRIGHPSEPLLGLLVPSRNRHRAGRLGTKGLKMILNYPFEIAPNLEPGLKVGDCWITLVMLDSISRDGRARYRYTIMQPGRDDVVGQNLRSGVGGGSLVRGFESLLAFLVAFAEARRYGRGGSDGWDLFPDELAEFAVRYSDEFGMLQYEIENNPDCIKEGE
jgi:hypothetical protein